MAITNNQLINDNNLVARYLADQLSSGERESFEEYFMGHPEMLRELNRTALFKAGLMDLREAGTLDDAIARPTFETRTKVLAVAASLVLIAIGTLTFLGTRTTTIAAARNTDLSSIFRPALPIASTFQIQRTRSSSYDASIELPTQTSAIEIRIKPESPVASARYSISLGEIQSDYSITHVTTITGLKQESDGFVTMYLNSARLRPAIYEVKISTETENLSNSAASLFVVEFVSHENSTQ